MAINSKCFTLKFPKKVAELKTVAGVCTAYDPASRLPHPPIIQFTALWDTGASKTAITKAVAEALNLKVINQVKTYHAGGHDMCNLYIVNILLPNGVGFVGMPVIEANLTGTDILLGMDIITSGDFSITNVNNKTTFSFRIPSEKEIDYVEQTKREQERNKNPKAHSNNMQPKKKRK